MKTVLTIAGYDPSSGAGITADLMVFAAHGLFGTSCITALTVQSTTGVRDTIPTPPQVVRATLECLDSDLPPAGIKVGMLATAENVLRVAEYLESLRGRPRSPTPPVAVVLDPVLRSSSGKALLDPPGVRVLRERLLPLVDWVTPNLDELALLSASPVEDRSGMLYAARQFQEKAGAPGPGVIATGGHLDPPDDLVLTPAGDEIWLTGERVQTRSTHGTGCAFSSAFLSRLVLGHAAPEAARQAKDYVAEALRLAPGLGSGAGPMNHLWPITRGRVSGWPNAPKELLG